MPTIAHRFARSSFRWAVANPQRDFASSVVAPVEFRALADRCFAMLQEAAQLDIEARLDCPLPLCFFTDSQLGWVRQYHPGTSQRMGCCGPALDVTPELEVIRCFALSKLLRVKLKDFAQRGCDRELVPCASGAATAATGLFLTVRRLPAFPHRPVLWRLSRLARLSCGYWCRTERLQSGDGDGRGDRCRET